MSSTLSVRSDLSCRRAGRLGEEVPRPSVPLSAAVPVLELGFGVASCRAFTTIGCSCEAWPPGVGSNVSHLTLSPRYKKKRGTRSPQAARKARQFLAMPMASIRADAVQLGGPESLLACPRLCGSPWVATLRVRGGEHDVHGDAGRRIRTTASVAHARRPARAESVTPAGVPPPEFKEQFGTQRLAKPAALPRAGTRLCNLSRRRALI